jgi:hypothetical protein
MDKICISTICSLNYFGTAVGLVESAIRFHPDADYFIFIVDRSSDEDVYGKIEEIKGRAHVVWIEDLAIPELSDMAKKYSVVEMNTAVKPILLKYLISARQYDKVFYIDPDIRLFGEMSEAIHLLDTLSVLLTPHLIGPEEDEDTELSSLDNFLQYGVYNLGFLALKNDLNSEKLLNWWHSKLVDKCYFRPEQFLAWDQKWMDFAPALFDRVHILRSPGYNMAFWNLQRRTVTRHADRFMVNGAHPLVFYHFSHYKRETGEYIADLNDPGQSLVKISSRPDLSPLFEYYNQTLTTINHNFFSSIKYNLSVTVR